jgi:O-antigen ligase
MEREKGYFKNQMSETRTQTRLFYVGWLIFFALAPFGNTSLGVLVLLTNSIYEITRDNRHFGVYKDSFYCKIALFILIMVISSSLAVEPGRALLATLGFIIVLYVVLFEGRYLAKEKRFLYSTLIPVFLLAAAISGAYTAILYVVFDVYRGHTLFTGTNGTGTLLAAAFAVGLGYFDYVLKQNKPKAMLAGAQLAVIGTGLLTTLSRGGWLGAFFSAVFYGLRSKQIRRVLAVAMIGIIIVISVVAPFQTRLKSIFSIERNMDRITIWSITLKMIADHPILGIGTSMFSSHWDTSYRPSDSSASIAYAHNIILQIAVEFGIIGLAVFALIIIHVVLIAFRALKTTDMLYRGIMAAFIAIFIHQQVDCTIYGLEHTALFWLIAILLVYLPVHEEKTISP